MNFIKSLLLISLITFTVISGEKDSLKSTSKSDGDRWAVQFEIGNDFKLFSFDNVLISLKYRFTGKTAARIGIGVKFSNSDQTLTYRNYFYGEDVDREPFNDRTKEYILISNFLYYPRPDKILKIFFGIGPRASYLYVNDERIYLDGYKGFRQTKSWTVGVNGVFGCEWFPADFLSLFGEYSAFAVYGKSKAVDYVEKLSNHEPEEYYRYESENFQFNGSTARLGLSVYF